MMNMYFIHHVDTFLLLGVIVDLPSVSLYDNQCMVRAAR
jgi:hypothetical protein